MNSVLAEPDDLLVDAARRGDTQAFGQLVRRHDDRMRGLAYKLLGGHRDRMDDVLQNAYLAAYRGLGTFRREAQFSAWLYRVTYNACMDELRRSQRQPLPVDVTSDPRWDRPDQASGAEDRVVAHDAVHRALSGLPDEQRVTVVLVDGEGLDNHTVAQLTGVAVGTVGSRLSRARAALRLAIGEEDR